MVKGDHGMSSSPVLSGSVCISVHLWKADREAEGLGIGSNMAITVIIAQSCVDWHEK